MPNPENITHQQDILREHKRRLEKLEVQASRSGHTTDPKILIEVEDLRKSITDINNSILELSQSTDIIPTSSDSFNADESNITRGKLRKFKTELDEQRRRLAENNSKVYRAKDIQEIEVLRE